MAPHDHYLEPTLARINGSYRWPVPQLDPTTDSELYRRNNIYAPISYSKTVNSRQPMETSTGH